MKERERSNKAKNKKGGVKAGTQKVRAKLLKSYYGNPAKDMKVIAKLIKLCATDLENSRDYIIGEVDKLCAKYPIYE